MRKKPNNIQVYKEFEFNDRQSKSNSISPIHDYDQSPLSSRSKRSKSSRPDNLMNRIAKFKKKHAPPKNSNDTSLLGSQISLGDNTNLKSKSKLETMKDDDLRSRDSQDD